MLGVLIRVAHSSCGMSGDPDNGGGSDSGEGGRRSWKRELHRKFQGNCCSRLKEEPPVQGVRVGNVFRASLPLSQINDRPIHGVPVVKAQTLMWWRGLAVANHDERDGGYEMHHNPTTGIALFQRHILTSPVNFVVLPGRCSGSVLLKGGALSTRRAHRALLQRFVLRR